MNLLVNFFMSNNDERNKEYLFALNKNIENEYTKSEKGTIKKVIDKFLELNLNV